jgi:hypothetical protein
VKIIDVIGKEIEIYKIKLLLFTSISGGSWIYALKFLNISYVIVLWFVFLISIIGMFLNMSKLSDLQKELREIKNG